MMMMLQRIRELQARRAQGFERGAEGENNRRSGVQVNEGKWQAMRLVEPRCRFVDATNAGEMGRMKSGGSCRLAGRWWKRAEVGSVLSIDDRERRQCVLAGWGGRPGKRRGCRVGAPGTVGSEWTGDLGACSLWSGLIWMSVPAPGQPVHCFQVPSIIDLL